MALISLAGLKQDTWQLLDAEQALSPTDGAHWLLPLSRAQAEPSEHLPSAKALGLLVDNTAEMADLLPWLERVSLISVAFPSTADGRGFSIGVELRNHGYEGLLRATGELIPDQFPLALDCGFNEVQISEQRLARQPLAQWLDAATSLSGCYQLDYHALSENHPLTSIWSRRAQA